MYTVKINTQMCVIRSSEVKWTLKSSVFVFWPFLHVLPCIPEINAFLKQTVKNCIKNGYVQTLMGRRRYLAGITSTNVHIKAHVSSRFHQDFTCETNLLTSVSLTLRGSFRRSGRQWTQRFRVQRQTSLNSLLWTSRNGCDRRILLRRCLTSTQVTSSRRARSFFTCRHVYYMMFVFTTAHNDSRDRTSQLRGAYFVLQLHDELIYETTEQDLIQVGTLRFGSQSLITFKCIF